MMGLAQYMTEMKVYVFLRVKKGGCDRRVSRQI